MLIEIFGRKTCPYCNDAISLLNKHSYRFKFFDMNKYELVGTYVEQTRSYVKIPKIFIDGIFLGGFDALFAWVDARI